MVKSGVRPMESGECPVDVRNCLLGCSIVRFLITYNKKERLIPINLSY